MRRFNELPDEILRHTRGYGLIPLTNEQKYILIQELFPTFSIERLDELTKKLNSTLQTLNSDQTLVYNALDDATQYEIYGEGGDITIMTNDALDLPYPSTEIKKGVYGHLDVTNIDTILYLLELSSTLKFEPPNRNTFVAMAEEGIKFLPFNEAKYKESYSSVSLNSILEYAKKLKEAGRNNYNIVRYDMNENKIYVDNKEPFIGTRDDYVRLCMSISELL